MAEPTVSIIVPTFNRARYLPECLESLLAQTLPPSEIVVVNDGSTDDTAQVIRPYLDRITYVEKENGGKSTALNLVMPGIQSDYVWIFDDDDVALPYALETHLRALEGRPEAGFSYSTYCEGIVGADGRLTKGPLYPLPAVDRDDLFPRLLEGCFIAQPATVVRSRCYREVGPFDTRLVRSQDYEMLLRLSRRFPAIRVDEPSFVLRTHSGLRGSSVNRFTSEHRPSEWFIYAQMVFRELHDELALCEYLPGGRKNEPLDKAKTRSALFQRMSLMARKGLWEIAARDLKLLVQEEYLAEPLTISERQACRKAMGNCLAIQEMPSEQAFLPAVRHLRQKGQAAQMRYEFARGLYYHVIREVRKGNYSLSATILTTLVSILGFVGTVNATRFKLNFPSQVE